MRTTLEIDDVVLAAARALAQAEGTSLGAAVSTLARRGLRGPEPAEGEVVARADTHSLPFPVLLGDPTHLVTPDLVTAHRDD